MRKVRNAINGEKKLPTIKIKRDVGIGIQRKIKRERERKKRMPSSRGRTMREIENNGHGRTARRTMKLVSESSVGQTSDDQSISTSVYVYVYLGHWVIRRNRSHLFADLTCPIRPCCFLFFPIFFPPFARFYHTGRERGHTTQIIFVRTNL